MYDVDGIAKHRLSWSSQLVYKDKAMPCIQAAAARHPCWYHIDRPSPPLHIIAVNNTGLIFGPISHNYMPY